MVKNKLILNLIYPYFLENNRYIFSTFQNQKNMNSVDCSPPEGDATTRTTSSKAQA
jgi:hypothetical protein